MRPTLKPQVNAHQALKGLHKSAPGERSVTAVTHNPG